MTVGITVGFSPVQGTGAALPGAAGDGAPAGGPLGAFHALLAALTPQGNSHSFNPGGHGQNLDADALAALLATDTPFAVVTTDGEEAPSAETLLTDLVRQLGALQDALNHGRAPEPALEQEMDQTLAALATALGISIDSDPPNDARIGATETNWLALASALSADSAAAGAHTDLPLAPGSANTAPAVAGTATAHPPGTQPRALFAAWAAGTDAPEVGTAAETRPRAGNGEAPAQAASQPPRVAPETIPASSATPPTTPQPEQVQAAVPPMAEHVPDTDAARVPPPPAGQLTRAAASTAPAPQADLPLDATQRVAAVPPAHPQHAGQAIAHPLPGETVTFLFSASAGGADPLRELAASDAMRSAATVEAAAKPHGDGKNPVLVRLAERLTALAETVKPAAPQLAQQLLALAARLDGMPDTGLAQKFAAMAGGDGGDSDLAAAIQRLLSDATPPRQPPAGEMPATARLVLPKLTGANASDGASPGERPVAQPAPELRLEAAGRPAADAQPSAPERPAAQAALRAEPMPAPLPGSGSAATAPDANQAQVATPANAAAVTSADARALAAAYRPAGPQINMPQLAVEIVRQVNAGLSRFQIRLDPPELGRIDVKLEMDAAGKTVARMTVERPETLDLMQRDQRALERALAQAGLDSSKTSLEFALKQNPFGRDDHHRQHRQGEGAASGRQPDIEETEAPMPPPQITAYRGFAAASGVNLFV